MRGEHCRQRYLRHLWVGTSLKRHLSSSCPRSSQSINGSVEGKEGCSGCSSKSQWLYVWQAFPKDQRGEAGSGEPASSTATKAVPQNTASLFFCSRHSLTHLWEASSKMSLRTNLPGLCHYLLGTQLREEGGRLQGRLPRWLPSPLLSQDVPKCLQGAGCTPSVALPHALLLPCACPKALFCLEGEFFSCDQNPLDLTMPGGVVGMEDTFLCASCGGF